MPGSPFLSTGPFPVSDDWLSAGSLIGSMLGSTELGSVAGADSSAGCRVRGAGLSLGAAGCIGRSMKHAWEETE